MAFHLRPKTKEEERKLEVGRQDPHKSDVPASDVAERRKVFNATSAPVRPPPPKPMARASKKDAPSSSSSTSTMPPPAVAAGAKKPPPANRASSAGAPAAVEGGIILDNSAAAKQPRKPLAFQSSKKASGSPMDKEKSKKQGSSGLPSAAESGSGGEVPPITTATSTPDLNGANEIREASSCSDDDGVIVEWKDEDSSEFSSIKASKYGTIIREGEKGPNGDLGRKGTGPVVRMSQLAAAADDHQPLIPRQSVTPSPQPAPVVAASPTPTAVTPVAPAVTPRDAPLSRNLSKRKTALRKEDHSTTKVSPIAGLPPTLCTPEALEGSKRFRVCQEIYSTEYSYVKNLEVLVNVYKTALKSVLSSKDLDCIFMNLESIFEFNCELLVELHDRFTKWQEATTVVGDVFTSTAARFNVYSVYCANHRDADEAVSKLKRKSDVHDAMQAAAQDPRVSAGLDLHSYLLTPVQRMPRYLLLLQSLLKNTADTHPDFELLREAIGKLDHITEHVNQQIREVQNQRALSDLRSQVVGLDAHDLPGRKLAKEGQVCLTSIRKLYQCILFNDLIVFALLGESKGKVEVALDLSTVWVHDLGENDPQTTSQDAIEIYTPDRPYTIYVKTVNEKRHWLNEIRSIILTHLKENSGALQPPADLEERTGIEVDKAKSSVVRASDVVHRQAKFSYSSGELYDGCWLDAMRHGEGEMTFRDRSTYAGGWVENERSGQGVLTYNTAEVYTGEWKNDVQNGSGSLMLCSGDEYTGSFVEALPQGSGKITYANGDEFTGMFDRATVTGDGVLKCKNGIEYDGQWLESQFDGEGKFTNRFGDRFEGELVHNCFHGAGVMRYQDGSVYDGIWEKGHRHGYGVHHAASGTEYSGNWRLDQRHGQGWQKLRDGSIYDGQWEYNMRHGTGQMRLAVGNEYSGTFKHDHMHGRGTMTYADGGVYIGEFKFGQRHGYGVMEYANGGHYDGSWLHDFREGEGTYTYQDESYSGDFAHDRPHGKGMYAHKGSSAMYTGQFVAGRRCGQGVETSPVGKFSGEWKYGMRHGPGKETSTVGTIWDGSWHCNQRNQKFAVRSVTGEVSDVTFVNGAPVGAAKAHDVPNMPILSRTLM